MFGLMCRMAKGELVRLEHKLMTCEPSPQPRWRSWPESGRSWLALCLSIIVGATQLYTCMRGPDVEFYPADRILFNRSQIGTCAKNEKGLHPECEFVRLHSGMAYTNGGALGYPDVILREEIDMQFCLGSKENCNDETYKQRWEMFGSFDQNQGNEKLEFFGRRSASPQIVKGEDAISHETYFTPDESKSENFILWDEFIEKLGKNMVEVTNNESKLEIEIRRTGDMLYDDDVCTYCRIEVSWSMIDRLHNDSWHTAVCREVRKAVGKDCT